MRTGNSACAFCAARPAKVVKLRVQRVVSAPILGIARRSGTHLAC